MFELKNVSKQFGSEYALRDISMEIGGGLSFLIGASGSGKTTLLRILSGMEPEFDGGVYFQGKDLKTLTDREKSGLYNSVFGFIWQDFNLLDDRTVLENVLLPRYLKDDRGEQRARSCLKELRILDLADKKVGKLSGGQKQRVAIARELMKEPGVILADEPTSALDRDSGREIMAILRNLAKRRTVIVVTHDTSLIREGDRVFELDKGELIACPTAEAGKEKPLPKAKAPKLTVGGAFSLAATAARRQLGRAVSSVLAVLLSAVLLLIPLSGAITGSGQAVFDELFETYGDSLLDISLYSSFFSASGTGGEDDDGPKADVEQNLDGLFARYRSDDRVQHVLFAQAFGDIVIQADGQDYSVENTNNSPVFHQLVAGSLPMGDGNEVAVPESFVEQMGISNQEALGKTVHFSGTVFNWESGEPVETPMECDVTIVGVVDTTMIYEYEGVVYETVMEDSFFFSPAALAEMREGAGMEAQPGSFYIRCKTPADLISVKDELNAEGIVPLGRFELVEDMVRLNQQTASQSGTAMWVIGMLSVVVVLAAALVTGGLRRREFAILRVSGFGRGPLMGLAAGENLLLAAVGAVLFLLASPLLNLGTQALWSVNILTPGLLFAGMGLCILLGGLSFLVTAVVAVGVKPQNCLRTGDR